MHRYPMSPSTQHSNRRRTRWRPGRHSRRRGTAVVETALLLPLLILLAFGSIELSNMVFLKQSLSIAAYEGARLITKPGSTQAQADARISEVLAARNVTSYTVQYTTTNGAALSVTPLTPRGTLLCVTVQSSNGGGDYGPLRMFTGRSVQCQTTMVRQ
jgi:Flp pilus assembly protein TadG